MPCTMYINIQHCLTVSQGSPSDFSLSKRWTLLSYMGRVVKRAVSVTLRSQISLNKSSQAQIVFVGFKHPSQSCLKVVHPTMKMMS